MPQSMDAGCSSDGFAFLSKLIAYARAVGLDRRSAHIAVRKAIKDLDQPFEWGPKFRQRAIGLVYRVTQDAVSWAGSESLEEVARIHAVALSREFDVPLGYISRTVGADEESVQRWIDEAPSV